MPQESKPITLSQRVADALESLIRSGALRPGERLPSVRRACAQHGVSLTTAVQAYRLLEDRGLTEARPQSGHYVRRQFRRMVKEPAVTEPRMDVSRVDVGSLQAHLFDALRQPGVVPLGAAYPGPENLPVAKLGRIMATLAREAGPRGVVYDMPPGCESLRRQIALRSLDRGLHLSPDEILTTSGGTEALALCLRAVTRPGDIVAVESPTYFGVLQQIEELGLRALEIPMHPQHGMNLDALEAALKTHPVAACLSVPNFSNPLGSLMPEENKQRLVEMLARRDIPLIEDDINGGLFHSGERPHAVRTHDTEGRVLLCGSFSKTLAPGYRVGWVVPGRYRERVHSLKLASTLATASLPQLAIAEFMANGGYDHHLRTLRRRLADQLRRMSEAVAETFPEEIRFTRPSGGFVLWVELPGRVSALELHRRAALEKVSIAPGPMFSATGGFRNFIRLNCGHPCDERILRAVEILGHLTKTMA